MIGNDWNGNGSFFCCQVCILKGVLGILSFISLRKMPAAVSQVSFRMCLGLEEWSQTLALAWRIAGIANRCKQQTQKNHKSSIGIQISCGKRLFDILTSASLHFFMHHLYIYMYKYPNKCWPWTTMSTLFIRVEKDLSLDQSRPGFIDRFLGHSTIRPGGTENRSWDQRISFIPSGNWTKLWKIDESSLFVDPMFYLLNRCFFFCPWQS